MTESFPVIKDAVGGGDKEGFLLSFYVCRSGRIWKEEGVVKDYLRERRDGRKYLVLLFPFNSLSPLQYWLAGKMQ